MPTNKYMKNDCASADTVFAKKAMKSLLANGIQ
jgi:hypothetical protein